MLSLNKHLATEIGEEAYRKIRIFLRIFLTAVDKNIGLNESNEISHAYATINSYRNEFRDHHDDEVLNDLFALDRYVDFFRNYGRLWKLIHNCQFSESWTALQDCMDKLRLVRKFSRIDFSKIEMQLIELEKTYPYKVFFSIGMLVDEFECSICGNDIDSPKCYHRKGHLYRGEMAVGIAKKIAGIDHIAMVKSPMDKRCVVVYPNNSEEFKLILFLSKMLASRVIFISDFGILLFSTKFKPDLRYRYIGRNDPCVCGSGKKLKKCCSNPPLMEQPHVEIVPNPITPENAIP